MWLRDIFLDGAATPPNLGGEFVRSKKYELGSTIHDSPVSHSDVLDPPRHRAAARILGGFFKVAMEVSRRSCYCATSGVTSDGFGLLYPRRHGARQPAWPIL